MRKEEKLFLCSGSGPSHGPSIKLRRGTQKEEKKFDHHDNKEFCPAVVGQMRGRRMEGQDITSIHEQQLTDTRPCTSWHEHAYFTLPPPLIDLWPRPVRQPRVGAHYPPKASSWAIVVDAAS